jgi:hypothetical protein
VPQNPYVVTPGIGQGIAEDGQQMEGATIPDVSGEIDDHGRQPVPGQ